MYKKSLGRNLLIIVALLALAGCGYSFNGTNLHSNHRSSYSFDDRSGVDQDIFEVRSDFNQITLRLSLQVDDGAVSWTLTDPAGETQWDGTVEAGDQLEEERTLPIMAGEWRLDLAFTEADGQITIDWQGSS